MPMLSAGRYHLGPNGAGKTTTIRLLLALARPTSGRAEIFGLDSQSQAVEAHRRLAYVPGEANLWPSLTGAETLHLLGRIQGHVDVSYRDQLIDRFQLDPSKKVRAYSKGNRSWACVTSMPPSKPSSPSCSTVMRPRQPNGRLLCLRVQLGNRRGGV